MQTPSYWYRRAGWSALTALFAFSAVGAPLQIISTLDASTAPTVAGGGDSSNPFLSADGRYVLFASSANNLALTSSNTPLVPSRFQRLNVYLRDRTNGTTTLVSVNFAGTCGGDGDSIPAGLSADGRYALFESWADDLLPGDTNNASDIFLRDLRNGIIVLVSAQTNGGWANGASSSAVMTPDGRYVAFSSAASDLVVNDTNGIPDIFVRDLSIGTTVLASAGAADVGSGLGSESPEITPDGRFVAFLSSASNLVAQAISKREAYLRDTLLGVTYLASVGAHDWIGSNSVACCHHLSDDGQYLACQANSSVLANSGFILRYSVATGLTDLVTSNAVPAIWGQREVQTLDLTPDGRFVAFIGRPDATFQSTNLAVFRWDGQTGTTILASPDVSNAPPTLGVSDWPVIDPTGQFITFTSSATNLTTNVIAGEFHLYLRDTQAGTTRLLDLGTSRVGSAKSFLSAPCLTPDARWLAFDCTDADLVPNDNNQAYDVFVCDLSTGAFEMESVRQPGLPSQTPQGSSSEPLAAVSADGRFVAFASTACNLTPNSSNASQALYLRDQLAGTNLLASADTNGYAATGGWSTEPALSADGRLVAFTSGATNLAPGDATSMPSPRSNVFVRDRQTGTNYLVSVNSTGAGAGNQPSYSPRISAGGGQVLFRSRASNLTSTSTTGENCFWRDLPSARTFAVTTTGSSCCALTPDGRFVAYAKSPTGMYLWDSQVAASVYTAATTSLVTNIAVSPDGQRLAGLSGSGVFLADRVAATNFSFAGPTTWLPHATLQFSSDGRFLVYVTAAALTAGDTNAATDVYLYDFQAQTNLLVSRSCNWSGAANAASDSATISADGRFIAYRSFASDVVPGDTNGVPDVFLYDRSSGITSLLSLSAWGDYPANNRSGYPVFSGDGQTIVFQSWASDLAPQDFNQSGDVFALKLATSGTNQTFSSELVFLPAAGGLPTLVWPAQPGTSYRVQFKDDLGNPVWQDLFGSVSLVGDHGYASDLLPSNGKRFYRIVGF
jgi:Tol biopolymer transport system component